MLRASSQLCPFCEIRTLFPLRTPKAVAPQWQQARFASQLQKRAKPSRMQLSPKVAQSKTKPLPRRQNGPFAGLNRTRVPSTLHAQAQAQAAKPTSSTHPQGIKGAKRSRDAKDRGPKEDPKWYKALKERRALSSVSYDSRANVKQRIAEIDDFQQFPLLPVIQNSILTQGLPGLEDITPTPAQRVAIPALLNMDVKRRRRASVQDVAGMQQFLLAAETGSGKTLAYLLPVIDAIKRLEMQEKEEEEMTRAEEAKKEKMFELKSPPLSGEEDLNVGRPRAIILVPSAELVAQVGAVLKSFSHTVKFRAALISAAFSGNVIRNRLFSPSGVDVVVATPHLLSSIAESDPDILSRVSHLVIDEADSLLDRSFSPLTSTIIDKSTPSLQQLVFCSATIPRSMDTYLRKRFPDIKRLVTPNIHAIPRRVQLGVVQVDQAPYKGNKDLACADTIWNIGRSAVEQNDDQKEVGSTKRIIVFVNEREKAIEVSKYLVSKGIDAVALNRDTLNERQSQTLAAFKGQSTDDETKPQPSKDPMKGSKDSNRQLANTKVLVATDLGSRGIDTIAVKTVILYDVPHSTVDFIHRLGRTGRMGKRGRGIVLLGKGDRADVVKDVREGMYRGQALI